MDRRRMNRGSVVEQLRRADAALQAEHLPAAAVRRVGRRIEDELADTDGSARMPRWVPMATFVGGAALVLAVLAIGGQRRTNDGADTPGTVVRGDDCRSDGARISGGCDVEMSEPAMTIHTARADIELHERTIDVRGGQADFDVDPVHDAPVRVRVPGGEIVVVGTRFRVIVDAAAQRGVVILHEGRLRFEADDGDVSPIEAGETFAFAVDASQLASADAPADARGIAAAPHAPTAMPHAGGAERERAADPDARQVPAPKPRASRDRDRPREPAPAPTPAPAPAPVDVDAVIAAVDASRRSGDYRGAADALRAALRGVLDPRAREVLSYELGTILTSHLHDDAQACAHWATHRERFGAGRYAKQVARAQAELACPSEP